MVIEEVVAYCGLTCQGCPIYWAGRIEDQQKQQKVKEHIARLCSQHYNLQYSVEDISDCDGCRSKSGRLFSGCLNCDIRQCALDRGFTTCAECSDYACPKLDKLYATDPMGRIWLDIVRILQ